MLETPQFDNISEYLSGKRKASSLVAQKSEVRMQTGSLGGRPLAGRARVLFLVQSALQLLISNEVNCASESPVKPGTMIYTRLRHDNSFLPLMKQFQRSKYPHEELEHRIRFDEIYEENKTRQVERRFFYNDRIDARLISEDDAVLESLDQVFKTSLIHFHQQEFAKPAEAELAYDKQVISEQRCQRELNYLLDKLDNLETLREMSVEQVDEEEGAEGARGLHPELLTWFDSTGGEPGGLLLGHYNWLGNWAQCSKRHIFDLSPNGSEGPIDFSGRYCLAKLRSPRWEAKLADRIREQERNNFFQFPGQQFDYLRYFRLQVGFCLPKACHGSRLFTQRDQDLHRLATFKLGLPFKNYKLADVYCLPDKQSELMSLSDSANSLLSAALVWLGFVFLASLVDWLGLIPSSAGLILFRKLIVSFSLLESYKTLVKPQLARRSQILKGIETTSSNESVTTKLDQHDKDTNQPSQQIAHPSDLLFVEFCKILITPTVIFGHIFMFFVITCKYPHNLDITGTVWLQALAGIIFYVDWYFCISGFVVAYSMFASAKVGSFTTGQWIYSLFHRYWRLAPCYMLYFWFLRELFVHTGSGPLWDYGTNNVSMRAICRRESWLFPATLTSNWHPIRDECTIPSWYISNDMQFHIVTPLLLLALKKSPTAGWRLVCSLIALCLGLRYHHYSTDPRLQHVELVRPRMDLIVRSQWDSHEAYLFPHYRCSPYLAGLLAGYYAYMVRSGEWKSRLTRSHWLQSFVFFSGLTIGLIMNIASYIADKSLPREKETNAWLVATFLYGTMHLIAAMGPALMLIALTCGNWPKTKQFMEQQVWIRMSRLNYFVYLCQVDVIIWFLTSGDQVPDLSNTEMFRLVFIVTPVLYLISILATLLIANPLSRLEQEFIGYYLMAPTKPKKA